MKYQICEPLTESEYADLKASVAKYGVLVPVEVDEQGNILDGHHRVRAWEELRAEGISVPQYARMIRSGMSEDEKFEHALRLNTVRRHMTPEARERTKLRVVDLRLRGKSYRQIAEEVGISHVRVREIALTAGVNPLTPIIGTDGKSYPAQQQLKPELSEEEEYFHQNHIVLSEEHEREIEAIFLARGLYPLIQKELPSSTFYAVWWGYAELATNEMVTHPGWERYVNSFAMVD